MEYYTEVKRNEPHLYISTWMTVTNTILEVNISGNYYIYISFKNKKSTIYYLGINTNVVKTSFTKSQRNNKYAVLSWLLGGW